MGDAAAADIVSRLDTEIAANAVFIEEAEKAVQDIKDARLQSDGAGAIANLLTAGDMEGANRVIELAGP